MDKIILAQSDIAAFASDLAMRLRTGDALLLDGPLGAGKTTLSRALIRVFMQDNDLDVQSPTFPLCLTYETPDVTIWHYDLYRLTDNADLSDLGWFEARRDGIAIVEWPERIHAGQLYKPYIHLKIAFTDDDNKREITWVENR